MQQQQEEVEPAADLFVTMAAKQERLFSAMVEFHREDLVRLEEGMGGVGREVAEAQPTGGYVNREKRLHGLQVSGTWGRRTPLSSHCFMPCI